MTDSELHPFVEWIAREARRPVVTDPAARERIMAAVRAEPVPVRRSGIWSRVVAPRVVHAVSRLERAARRGPRRHRRSRRQFRT